MTQVNLINFNLLLLSKNCLMYQKFSCMLVDFESLKVADVKKEMKSSTFGNIYEFLRIFFFEKSLLNSEF